MFKITKEHYPTFFALVFFVLCIFLSVLCIWISINPVHSTDAQNSTERSISCSDSFLADSTARVYKMPIELLAGFNDTNMYIFVQDVLFGGEIIKRDNGLIYAVDNNVAIVLKEDLTAGSIIQQGVIVSGFNEKNKCTKE